MISCTITTVKDLEGQGGWRVTSYYITSLYHPVSKVYILSTAWKQSRGIHWEMSLLNHNLSVRQILTSIQRSIKHSEIQEAS